jgi:hypothetical protein
VDAVGEILSRVPEGQGARLTVSLPAALAPLVAEKGSIAIDGVSLTVARAGRDRFEVALIPETLARTTLGAAGPGERVNLEADVVARHVARLVELGAAAGGARPAVRVAHAALTILLSWAFIHTIFALHYAHEFYDVTAGGLVFPQSGGDPDYWDFVYFSFVIGMTSQVSDVAVTSQELRRIVTAHGVLSFVFNAALLALTVNLAAGAL